MKNNKLYIALQRDGSNNLYYWNSNLKEKLYIKDGINKLSININHVGGKREGFLISDDKMYWNKFNTEYEIVECTADISNKTSIYSNVNLYRVDTIKVNINEN